MQYLSPEQTKEAIAKTQIVNPDVTFLVHGSPGVGKTSVCPAIAEMQNIPLSRVMSIHLGNYDRVELGGVPEIAVHEETGERVTVFRPTDVLAAFRKGTGPALLVLEEVATCDKDMQQFVAQLIEDRKTGNLELDPEVRIIATCNRVEDRAGAKPLLAHLQDRFSHIGMTTGVDDWCGYSMDNGTDPLGIAFIRLRPDLLNNFDPNRASSGTPRSWTKLFNKVPNTLPTNLYYAVAEGIVGDGEAAEWVAARDMMHKMPSIDVIRMQPDVAEVPTEPAVKFAVATALSMTTTPDAFPRDMQYVIRMPKEFQMVYMKDALRLDSKLQQTKAFIDWAMANKDIFTGGN
tara:strand:- start:1618 stop:2655 length:1038 start_codon:yes stop_codon:yes gene_type:complete